MTGSALGASHNKILALWEEGAVSVLPFRSCEREEQLLEKEDVWNQIRFLTGNDTGAQAWPSSVQGEERVLGRGSNMCKGPQARKQDVPGPVSRSGSSAKLISDHRSPPGVAWPKPSGINDSPPRRERGSS